MSTMAGELNQLMGLWNEWATQILVLLSLALQLVLNVLAKLRRRQRRGVTQFPLWLAYQLADSTAIYTVGQLSLSGVTREHKLVAFWAPFLLLHLGGPDNITAYALEDNKLWTRHALTLAVQVLGVVYVLYMYIALNGRLIVLAAALMFLVGTAKYVERTYALWSANFSSIRKSLKVVPRDKHHHLYMHSHRQGIDHDMDDEFLLQRAHSVFYVCKRGIVDSVIGDGDGDLENPDTKAIRNLFRGENFDPSTVTLMQMELSLMISTMGGGLDRLMGLWNQWTTQILVLLSLTLQVVLHVVAGVRRREMTRTTAVKRILLWLAYQLADTTAIYTIGHLSLSSAPREHKLVAFWAPFLLLHLGGPDSITAYALEDNKLWKRHAVTLAVQVLGVVYVLYTYIAGNGMLIVLAAAMMFLVGTAKYVERTVALWSANFSSIQNSLKVVPRDKHRQHFYIKYEHPHEPHHQGPDHQGVDDEFLLQRAHSLFHVCKRGIVDSVFDDDDPENPNTMAIWELVRGEKFKESMWTVMQMELSLMYDILYTKANVIHNHTTCIGYGIRAMAPLAVVISLVLFQFSGKGGHNRVDVAITYVLLGGALILETKSLLSSLGSTWALAFLCATRRSWLRHAALCSGRWHRLRRALVSLRRPGMSVTSGSSRK
ncbi:hypothetical protein GUJ93_ZPchr0004g39847 [Zizania palustris]|uniref:DUF4220 domain-containing protein n=1 Tax=Zizania palustris TaxID=103762 RepID=A0A8J5SI19_ZIZPA|nr:hypothetical protein GUJ93_ZPchr0004g39847 [Zizania palustris]